MAQKYYVIVLFQDGLQIVPNIWLNKNLTTAKWPDYISNQRYDKAVKNMEDPQPDWIEYPVTKIFRTYTNYAVARRKLKEAEELTDIDSCTEQEEHLKKTRKIRAAKTIETSSSHDEDEFSEIIKFVSNLPKVPSSSKTDIETSRKSTRERKDDKFVKNDTGKYVRITDNSEPSCSSNYFGTMQKDTQRTENLFLHSNSNTECSNGILTTLIENNSNLKPDEQFINQILDADIVLNENNANIVIPHAISENNITVTSNITNSNLSSKREAQRIENMLNAELANQDNNENVTLPIVENIDFEHLNLNFKQGSQDVIDFIIKKLIKLDLKTTSIEKHVKLMVRKVSQNMAQPEQKQIIDVFQDLPLKSMNDLELIEQKLSSNVLYQNEMIKQLTRFTCKDLRASCSQVMKRTLSNKIANNYS